MTSAISDDLCSLGWLPQYWLTTAVLADPCGLGARQTSSKASEDCSDVFWFAYLQNADKSLRKCGWSHLHQSVFTTKRRLTSRKYWIHLIRARVYSPQYAHDSRCPMRLSVFTTSRRWTSRKYWMHFISVGGLLENFECASPALMRTSENVITYPWPAKKCGRGHTSQVILENIEWVFTWALLYSTKAHWYLH